MSRVHSLVLDVGSEEARVVLLRRMSDADLGRLAARMLRETGEVEAFRNCYACSHDPRAMHEMRSVAKELESRASGETPLHRPLEAINDA